MKEPSPMPEAVIDGIFKWAGVRETHECGQPCNGSTNDSLRQAQRVLREIRWDSINGCYHFEWAGMYVGVETDGYVHT